MLPVKAAAVAAASLAGEVWVSMWFSSRLIDCSIITEGECEWTPMWPNSLESSVRDDDNDDDNDDDEDNDGDGDGTAATAAAGGTNRASPAS